MSRLPPLTAARALYWAVMAQSVGIGAIFGWQATQSLPGTLSVLWQGWILCVCALCSLWMFLLYSHRMGHPGAQGLLAALVAQTYMTVFGSLIAGTLCLPGLGTLYGPIFAAKASLSSPTCVGLIVAQMVACHYALVPWQRARTDAIVPHQRSGAQGASRSGGEADSPVIGAL